ncbi:MAG: isoaspartyl peptidase/L-asparaginase [Candidatus Thorarchaeota archaeon]|jgi:beta-aspartyl-peptidase (threonine type)
MSLPIIVVHGGAGSWKDERIPVGIEYVKKAAEIGYAILKQGGNSLDAAEACTTFMENCGQLNAGLGATKNSDLEQELDAMIVDGSTLSFGSVAAIKGIQNPTALARYILEKTDHSFFAGENAKRLYDRMISEGFRKEEKVGVLAPAFGTGTTDTVGCVTVDSAGRIAATSSTGGMKNKIPGRVGDSPVMGAGAFANRVCGASATGYGEHIMRVVLSRMTVFYAEDGLSPQDAAEKGMNMFATETHSEAGIVVADVNGNWGKATNAKAMPTVVIKGNGDEILSFSK